MDCLPFEAVDNFYGFYVKTEIQGCISIRNVLQQYYEKMNFKLASFFWQFFLKNNGGKYDRSD